MSVFITFWASVVNILCCPLHLIKAVGLYEGYKRIFPFCCNLMTGKYNKKMHDQKKELFRSLSEFAPSRGPLTILEVGCGTGANFEFYPAGSRVLCTDPNPHFQKYLKTNIEKNDHLTYEQFVVASGEDLGSFEDESVDAVVCTLVLCSVRDVTATLREAIRVLRPGGAFFFLEHVVADPSTWTHFFQHVIQPLWYYFGDGCAVTRESWKNLEEVGFSDLKLRHIEAPLAFIIRPHIVGYGVK
ncbi:methyltransferase-like protein 7A [Oryzias latipes]|uniref:Methyltransferase type 11 domain-containing protein n=1 Tax=Oryzias latipes TaxID=8090 RepID=H2MXX2_ORYLA|nr:methyltransferase-like protein 7A [Oryzias latipes]